MQQIDHPLALCTAISGFTIDCFLNLPLPAKNTSELGILWGKSGKFDLLVGNSGVVGIQTSSYVPFSIEYEHVLELVFLKASHLIGILYVFTV